MKIQWKNSPYPPREWQSIAVQKARDALEKQGIASGVISAVMGAGKSAVIGELCYTYAGKDDQIVVVTTPSLNLVHQLAETLTTYCDAVVGKYYGKEKQIMPVTVCCMKSALSLAAKMEIERIKCRLWIADEAHKTECATMKQAYAALMPSRAIGMTATPFRALKHEELSLWTSMIYEYSPADAIKDGVVVPPKVVSYDGPEQTIDQACVYMITKALETYGPGIVNAQTVDDANNFARVLWSNNIPASVVHSKQSNAVNEHNIAQLKDGKIKAIVHVDMLAEGADFPWLEWLCLRRPVKSRVRFCQEVGRVLRTSPGKAHGLVLDPHDLFDGMGLSGDYDAVLAGGGGGDDRPVHQEAAEDIERVLETIKTGEPMAREAMMAIVLSPAIAWIRSTKMALKSLGLIDEKIKSTSWRKDFPSASQIKIMEKTNVILCNKLPKFYKIPARACTQLAMEGLLTKGDTSDLITIGFAISKHGWPADLDGLIT